MLEVEVHQQLRAFLRACGDRPWLHHLTLARLVARVLRSGRSSLIQGGTAVAAGRHRLSYLAPALLCEQAVVLVVPRAVQQRLLEVDLARLRLWLTQSDRPLPPVHCLVDQPPEAAQALAATLRADQPGLWILSPSQWLADRLELSGQRSRLAGLPTLIDGADDLERWTQETLRLDISPADWHRWRLACPDRAQVIHDLEVAIAHGLLQHPPNPYGAWLLDEPEAAALLQTLRLLAVQLPPLWRTLLHRAGDQQWPILAQPDRQTGQFHLQCQPIDVAEILRPLWQAQPIALIGSFLDLEVEAPLYQARLGLDNGDEQRLTCLKFTPDRQQEAIGFYLPEQLPLPNTPQFQAALIQQLYALLAWQGPTGFTVVLVGDVPLKGRLAAQLAAEFGSRVQLERTAPDDNGILVTGWDFWRNHSDRLPAPHLLVIAALPIPSLEDPLVAARVSAYKRQRRDWFRWYLLPSALSDLQRSIAPLRERSTPDPNAPPLLALLDTRVVRRSYGSQVLAALDPVERMNDLEPRWL